LGQVLDIGLGLGRDRLAGVEVESAMLPGINLHTRSGPAYLPPATSASAAGASASIPIGPTLSGT
jgi:hypothetical protein